MSEEVRTARLWCIAWGDGRPGPALLCVLSERVPPGLCDSTKELQAPVNRSDAARRACEVRRPAWVGCGRSCRAVIACREFPSVCRAPPMGGAERVRRCAAPTCELEPSGGACVPCRFACVTEGLCYVQFRTQFTRQEPSLPSKGCARERTQRAPREGEDS